MIYRPNVGRLGVPKSLERLTKPGQGEDKRSADEVSVTRVRRIQTASATSLAPTLSWPATTMSS